MPPNFSKPTGKIGAIKLISGRLLPRSNRNNRFHRELANEQDFPSAPKTKSLPVKTAGIQSNLSGDDACVALVSVYGHSERDIGFNGNRLALRALFHRFRSDSTNAEPKIPIKSDDYATHSKSSKKYL